MHATGLQEVVVKTSTASFIALLALAAGACASAPASRATEGACRQADVLAMRRADLVLQRGRAQATAQEASQRQLEATQRVQTGAATSDAGSTPAPATGAANFDRSSVSSSYAEVQRLDREIAQLDGSVKSLPTAEACRSAGLS